MEIPEDVWAEADKLLDILVEEARGDDLDPWTVAARSIMAERQRCALIATEYANEAWGHSAEIAAASSIASAILSTEEQKK